ncbi:hypothetical protein DIPPA_19159 [Diplonema papillatum]|nr:hypothetical protein DIPPA_19159 [Diplonema papillatum]
MRIKDGSSTAATRRCAPWYDGAMMLGYNGSIMDYVWRHEFVSCLFKLLEYVNELIKQHHMVQKPVKITLALVEMIRLMQRAGEMLLRMRTVGSLHWPTETPKVVLKLIIAIESVKAALLLASSRQLKRFVLLLQAWCRTLPKGKRSGLRMPLVLTDGSTPSVPPVVTMWDVVEPLVDTAAILRPVAYSSFLLLDHNKGRPWRPSRFHSSSN